MDLRSDLRKLGGVTTSRQLILRGHTSTQVQAWVRQGLLLRPRRGWVALPGADPELIYAAKAGVVLTCVTQARRLGLWVLDHEDLHVAAPRRGAKFPADAFDGHSRLREPRQEGQERQNAHQGEPSRLIQSRESSRFKHQSRQRIHWGVPVVPRAPGTVADSLENVLWFVAACIPHEQALAVWDSALNQQLTSYDALSQLPLRGRSRRILAASSPFADSGLETLVRDRLGWMDVSIAAQVALLGHRVDFLLGKRLVLQIDGGHHVGKQRTSDNQHDAQLRLQGYHVIRVSYWQVVHNWPEVQELVTRAVARRLHERR